MSIDSCFEVKEPNRNAFIDKQIVAHLPKKDKPRARERAIRIVTDFVGQDVNALSVLAYAAEKGRFDEYAQKLEAHYGESLQFVHPEGRKHPQVPGAVRAKEFFLRCYEELGIQRRPQ